MSGDGSQTASGLATAVAELLSAPQARPDDQGSLFDPSDFEPEVETSLPPAKSGPQGGRPKGARNKSTEALRAYIMGRYEHPLIGLAEMWSRSPKQLAEQMGLYKFEYYEGIEIARHLDTGLAARLQADARTAALPYLTQKMPVQIEAKGDKLGTLILGTLNAQINIGAGALPIADNGNEGGNVLDVSPLGGDAA